MFGKRRKRGPKPEEVALGRVVTPMLDMTFQLLFFFVMQFKPPISEGQIDFNMPSDGPSNSQTVENQLDEKPDEYKLTIIAPTGIPAVIQWRSGLAEPETFALDENQSVGSMIRALEDKLKTITKPAEGKGKPPVINIESDKRLKYAVLILIMDACKKNGFNNVGVMPLGKDKKGPA